MTDFYHCLSLKLLDVQVTVLRDNKYFTVFYFLFLKIKIQHILYYILKNKVRINVVHRFAKQA
jgi:hypothetical protein